MADTEKDVSTRTD